MALPLAQLPVRDEIHAGNAARGANATGILQAPRLLGLWHLASLDAPTVAVVWSLAFAWATPIHITGRAVLLLALTTWCAYVVDRLLDARAGIRASNGTALRERHYFHWRHRRLLCVLAAAGACVAGAVALILLPSFVREVGLVLGAAALIYFLGVHAAPKLMQRTNALRFPVSKELLVAVLFTAGCVLPAWSRLHVLEVREFSRLWFWVPAAYFAALAWLNCSCIARWESRANTDDREDAAIFAHARQRPQAFAALFIACAGLLLAIPASASRPRTAELLLAGAASALMLAGLDRMRMRMTPIALRATADLVLLTPLLLLLR